MRSFSLPERIALIVELERRLTVQDGVHVVQVPRLVYDLPAADRVLEPHSHHSATGNRS
jgi:hypothetical protein